MNFDNIVPVENTPAYIETSAANITAKNSALESIVVNSAAVIIDKNRNTGTNKIITNMESSFILSHLRMCGPGIKK